MFDFEYQLLGRLKSDCDYFLGAGNGCEKHLWAGSVDGQIEKMKEIYRELPKKPEWLTAEQINRYYERMVTLKNLKDGGVNHD